MTHLYLVAMKQNYLEKKPQNTCNLLAFKSIMLTDTNVLFYFEYLPIMDSN